MRGFNNIIFTIIAMFVAIVFVACGDDSPVDPSRNLPKIPVKARRTVMVYMAFDLDDGNLVSAGLGDLREMMRARNDVPTDCRLLVFIDVPSGARIYEVGPYYEKDTVRLATIGTVCSAEGPTLVDALQRMTSLAPAQGYALVLSSHGSGWLPGMNAGHTKAVLYDNNCNLNKRACFMDISELHEALRTIPKLEYLLFDACLMQSVEVAYELRDETEFILGSPAEISGRGMYYDKVMPWMFRTPFDVFGFAQLSYQCEKDYWEENAGQGGGGIVFSVVKTSEMQALADCAHRVLISAAADGEPENILNANGAQVYWRYSEGSQHPDMFDIKGVFANFDMADGYDEWLKQLDKTVIACNATRYWDSMCKLFEDWSGVPRIWGYRGEVLDVNKIAGMTMFVPDNTKSGWKDWNEAVRETAWWKNVMKKE